MTFFNSKNLRLTMIFPIMSLLFIFSTCQAKEENNVIIDNTKFVEVKLSNENIVIEGSNYINRSDKEIYCRRFSDYTLSFPTNVSMFNAEKAKSCSGVKIVFKSNSPIIKLTFSPKKLEKNRSDFAILQDGEIIKTFSFNNTQASSEMLLEIGNSKLNSESKFEVVLPSLGDVSLTKFEINEGAKLYDYQKEEKPVYIAIGNSITHGVGQNSSSYLTYPYLLSEKLNSEYYNLAVGGAKISQYIAEMTAEMPQADIITILIGYNGMVFRNKSTSQFKEDYSKYLDEIRKNQKNAKIYCISLTYTNYIQNDVSGETPDTFRKALESLIEEKIADGDDKVFLIEGNKITTESDLNDKVHLSIDGANSFAEELYQIIK